MELHLTATGCHLSHSVTCQPTQVNLPCLKPVRGQYSIFLPGKDGRLSLSNHSADSSHCAGLLNQLFASSFLITSGRGGGRNS